MDDSYNSHPYVFDRSHGANTGLRQTCPRDHQEMTRETVSTPPTVQLPHVVQPLPVGAHAMAHT